PSTPSPRGPPKRRRFRGVVHTRGDFAGVVETRLLSLPANRGKKRGMTMLSKALRPPEAAPALFRLISDGALSRAALSACGFPLAMLDASGNARLITSV